MKSRRLTWYYQLPRTIANFHCSLRASIVEENYSGRGVPTKARQTYYMLDREYLLTVSKLQSIAASQQCPASLLAFASKLVATERHPYLSAGSNRVSLN